MTFHVGGRFGKPAQALPVHPFHLLAGCRRATQSPLDLIVVPPRFEDLNPVVMADGRGLYSVPCRERFSRAASFVADGGIPTIGRSSKTPPVGMLQSLRPSLIIGRPSRCLCAPELTGRPEKGNYQ